MRIQLWSGKKDVAVLLIFVAVLVFLVYVITQPVGRVSQVKDLSHVADPVLLQQHVQYLSTLPNGRSSSASSSLSNAANYIDAAFREYCERVEEQAYTAHGAEVRNVSCIFAPESRQTIVVGAHYDAYEDLPGADDNASGVAGIVELARLLATASTTGAHRIELVAYTLEEPPYFRSPEMGSARHAKRLHDEGREIKAMLALEMIGYYTETPKSQNYPIPFLVPFYPREGNFIAVISHFEDIQLTREVKKLLKSALQIIDVHSFNAPEFIPGVDFSDHRSYWQYGFPAVMITDTAWLRNENYHKETDTYETLDYNKMADVVTSTYWAVRGLDCSSEGVLDELCR